MRLARRAAGRCRLLAPSHPPPAISVARTDTPPARPYRVPTAVWRLRERAPSAPRPYRGGGCGSGPRRRRRRSRAPSLTNSDAPPWGGGGLEWGGGGGHYTVSIGQLLRHSSAEGREQHSTQAVCIRRTASGAHGIQRTASGSRLPAHGFRRTASSAAHGFRRTASGARRQAHGFRRTASGGAARIEPTESLATICLITCKRSVNKKMDYISSEKY